VKSDAQRLREAATPSQLSFVPRSFVNALTWAAALDLAVDAYWRNRPDPRAAEVVRDVVDVEA
jgi:hypothetical protein